MKYEDEKKFATNVPREAVDSVPKDRFLVTIGTVKNGDMIYNHFIGWDTIVGLDSNRDRHYLDSGVGHWWGVSRIRACVRFLKNN